MLLAKKNRYTEKGMVVPLRYIAYDGSISEETVFQKK